MNITLAMDDDLVNDARAYARRRGTTLNALVREQLARAVEEERQIEKARDGLRDLLARSILEVGAEQNVKELARDRDPELVSRHEYSDQRGGGQAA